MRSVNIAFLVMFFLVSSFLTPSVHSQAVSKNRPSSSSSSSAVPMQTVQNQIEEQRSEIEALRMRLAALQREYEDLAEKIADQSSKSDDDDGDDDADIPEVPSLRVHSIGKSNRSATPAAWPSRAVYIDKTKLNCGSQRVH